MKIINTFSFTNNKILNICYYLILFFPLALIVGPLIGEIFLLLLILITFTFRDFRKNFFEIVKNNLVLKMILLFSIYIFFLSLLSYDNFDILKTGIFYFRYALFSLAIYYIVLKKSDVLKNFFIFYFFLILVILIDSFIQHYFGQNILGYQKFGSRIVSFFEGEGILGSFIVRFYALVSVFYFLSKFLVNRLIILTVISLIFILIIFTLERSALLLFLISNLLIFFSIYQNKKKFVKKFSFLLLIITISFYLISIKNDFFMERFYTQTKNEVAKLFDDTTDSKRKNILIVAYNMGSKNYLLGLGPKSFRYKCKELEYQVEKTKEFDERKRLELNCITHPHNYIFQLYAETGLIGLFFYLFFFIYLLKKIFLTPNQNLNSMCLKLISISLLINLFPLIGNGNIFNNFLSMIFFYNLGFFLFFNKNVLVK